MDVTYNFYLEENELQFYYFSSYIKVGYVKLSCSVNSN